ncbi:hypothetical protein KPC83_01495 [Collinsella sp. zg1085]|uniref:hypothetical protein n=1 Tax=Collinsella sp. zg1085 TaxID=2844380 RepID=UPI001C0B080E|nr:hypothetical protein [Collinsella sp. zg1085]QWT17855.1 hypothetical protein KPC83_01495 [Collinsella sp. zg1085]
MTVLIALLFLAVIASVVILTLTLAGILVGMIFHLVPLLVIGALVVFFIRGGRIRLDWPEHYSKHNKRP